MATKKKLLEAAAGSAGGAGLNIEELFSTYVYDGTSADRAIVNDIDLSTEGGAVWFKGRSSSYNHILYDTERGVKEVLRPNRTDANSQLFGTNGLTAFNTNGFSITGGNGELNYSGQTYASWTWRKAPKFFDIVQYTGTGSDQLINHNLGCVPGFVVVKRLSSTGSSSEWSAYHRSLPNNQYVVLNLANSAAGNNPRTVTDTQYMVHGNYPGENESGKDYIAYLWAHNNGDGEFGPDADQDVIKCGSFYFNGSTTVNLGFEPQWILAKRTDSSTTGDWFISDIMRGWTVNTSGYPRERFLNANQSWGESLDSGGTNSYSNSLSWAPTSTGFKVFGYPFNNPGNYIYMAIRRGPMAVPESATDVFTPVLATSSGTFTAEAGFPVDLNWYARRSVADGGFTWDRLRGANYLKTNSNGAETAYSAASFDSNTAFYLDGLTGDYSDFMTYNWGRAPNFFDVVAYTGNGTAGRTVSHNLGVAPEMMWVKRRDGSKDWFVYHSDVGAAYSLKLNLTNASGFSGAWNSTAPSDTSFTVGNGIESNYSNYNYIAYLFASLDGVSKVGSYTGDGTTGRVIDCGFSSGARFVLIKRTDTTDSWYVWDSVRGIVTGNDPYFLLNSNAAEDIYTDAIEPHSSGFIINQEVYISRNFSGGDYIFYAIA